jgi:hypothetical protein
MARPEASELQQRHALELAKIALFISSGFPESTVDALLALPGPAIEKRDLLGALVLAGVTIQADMVIEGLSQLLEQAKTKSWLLDQHHNGAEHWLELLVFSDRPESLMEAIDLIDAHFVTPQRLHRLLAALANAPEPKGEQLLMQLAERNSNFYGEHEWRNALIDRGTESAGAILLNLLSGGKLTGAVQGMDTHQLSQGLSALMVKSQTFRQELYKHYESLPPSVPKSVLGRAIRDAPDEQGVILLVNGCAADGMTFSGDLYRAIKEVALGKRFLPHQLNTYELFSVDAAALRKRLFAMLSGSSAQARLAESSLVLIDDLHDRLGRVDTEPRHPDIASGRPWPLAAA